MYTEEGEQKKHEPRIPSRSLQAHGGKSFWGPCGVLPAPALLGTYRPSRPRSADAPAGPGPESHLCSARGPRSAHARQPSPPHCIVLSSGGSVRRPLARPALQQPRPRPFYRPRPSGPAPAGSAALLCSAQDQPQAARNPSRLACPDC